MRGFVFLLICGCFTQTEFEGKRIQEGQIIECTEEVNAFDIEDVSTLQDALSESMGNWRRDGVLIDYGQGLDSNVTWRISSVDILIMIPEDKVSMFQDGNTMQVEIYDSADPRSVEPYVQIMEVHRVDLQWTLYTLPDDAAHASVEGEYEQYGAWLSFDFLDVIPSTGMLSQRFVVAVDWPDPGEIAVGYSNFNRSCASNWSDYGEGWVLNSDDPMNLNCSWPMMRIQVEKNYPGGCE